MWVYVCDGNYNQPCISLKSPYDKYYDLIQNLHHNLFSCYDRISWCRRASWKLEQIDAPSELQSKLTETIQFKQMKAQLPFNINSIILKRLSKLSDVTGFQIFRYTQRRSLVTEFFTFEAWTFQNYCSLEFEGLDVTFD